MVTTVYKGTSGTTVALSITEEDGTAINLTSATVVSKMYNVGSNVLKTSNSCTVTGSATGLAQYTAGAANFNTAGTYYTIVDATYTSGNVRTVVGPTFEVIENEENIVTTEEFLQFIDIPEENAKKTVTIKQYLEEAETLVSLEVPNIANTTNSGYIKLKKTLVKLKAGILYFANSDESFGDPNKRIAKIQLWTDMYNRAMEHVNDTLSSTSTGSANIRRVKNSAYSDSTSYLYDGDS